MSGRAAPPEWTIRVRMPEGFEDVDHAVVVQCLRREAKRRTRAGEYCVFASFRLDFELIGQTELGFLFCDRFRSLVRMHFGSAGPTLGLIDARLIWGPTGSSLPPVLKANFQVHTIFPGPIDYEERKLDFPIDRTIQELIEDFSVDLEQLAPAESPTTSLFNVDSRYYTSNLMTQAGNHLQYGTFSPPKTTYNIVYPKATVAIGYPSEADLAAWYEFHGIVPL